MTDNKLSKQEKEISESISMVMETSIKLNVIYSQLYDLQNNASWFEKLFAFYRANEAALLAQLDEAKQRFVTAHNKLEEVGKRYAAPATQTVNPAKPVSHTTH